MADSIREGLAKLDFEPEVILTSFHGVPQSYLLKGDPYHCQCVKTGRLIREALGFSPERDARDLPVALRQRGMAASPTPTRPCRTLAKSGVKRMAIVAPGFTADCLETLEELDGENRHYFEDNGGERFAYIPCLNDSDLGMKVIETRGAAGASGLGLIATAAAALLAERPARPIILRAGRLADPASGG